MRWPRRVMAALSAMLLLAVPPLVLTRAVGWPAPGSPDLAGVKEWVSDPLTEQTLAVALVLSAWLVWLLLVITVLARLVARLRLLVGRLRRVPLPTPMQATATGMAGVAVFGVGTGNAAALLTAHPNPSTNSGTTSSSDPAPLSSRSIQAADSTHTLGVEVPGGWLPDHAADDLAAAVGLYWLRRRRDYRTRPVRDRDDDLVPLSATVAAVQVAHASRRALDTADVPPPMVAAIPSGVIGLIGPGSADAARGLIVTTLLRAARQPSPQIAVLITGEDLTALLGPHGSQFHALPGLRVIGSVAEAIAMMGTGRGTETTDQHPAAGGERGSGRRVLVIADGVDPAVVAPVTARGGTDTVVLLGTWPYGDTWHVDPAGHLTEARPGQQQRRLCVLNQAAATDLLAVLAPPAATGEHSAETAISHVPPGPLPRQRTPARRTAPPPIGGAPQNRARLRVLGEVTLSWDGRPLTIRRSAAIQALAYLAVHRGGATSKDLTQAIWPGLPAHSLTGRLYTTLSDLRAALRPTGLTLVDHTGDRYRLDPDDVDVDLWHLQDTVSHATTTVTRSERAWRDVIAAYRGELAAGHGWPWLHVPRETTRRHVIDAYIALAETDTDPHARVNLLQAAIRVDPYNEHLHRATIDALVEIGDQGATDVLRRSYRQRLAAAGMRPQPAAADTADSLADPSR